MSAETVASSKNAKRTVCKRVWGEGMTVNEMSLAISARVLALADSERQINGVYIGDLLSWVMGRASADNVWITIMSNANIIAVASLIDVSCIILAEGVVPGDEVIELARTKGINLLCSEKTAYEIAVDLAGILI